MVDGVISFAAAATIDAAATGSLKAGAGRALDAGLPLPESGLKELLAGRLGETFSVRVKEVLGPEKLLLEIAGSEVVARGAAPAGSTGWLTVRLESVEPLIQLSLAEADSAALPPSIRQNLSELVLKPNMFSENLMELKTLLLDKNLPLPMAARHLLENLISRFSLSTLLGDLRGGAGLALDKLGLLHEPELGALLLSGAEKKSAPPAGREPLNIKESLLRLLADLGGGPAAESPAAAGERALSEKLHSTLNSLKDMVELNQVLNNPGLKNEAELLLLLPLWSGEVYSDLWLRLSRNSGGSGKGLGGNLYTLMIYLDFAELGPLGAQLVVGNRELQAKFLTVAEDAARNLRKLLPEARERLRGDFPGGLLLQVETVGTDAVAAFRQRAFLASLPPLLKTSG